VEGGKSLSIFLKNNSKYVLLMGLYPLPCQTAPCPRLFSVVQIGRRRREKEAAAAI
jgi:hypothetical protein